MKRRCLAICLIALLALAAGCIADDFPSKDNEHLGGNNASDTGDLDDAGDAPDTPDGGADTSDADTDIGPQTCESDGECTGGADNQVGTCNADGECTYSCEEGFEDCDGDDSNGCEADLSSASTCGSCTEVCGGVDDGMHHRPVCEDSDTSSCGVDTDECEDGWVDANGDSADGCECEFVSDEDTPDADGIDQNCDGIDGTVAHAVFVAEDGDNSNDGLEPDQAVVSISQALDIAKNDDDRSYILVAGGTYEEVVTLESGISIYGGYKKGTWERTPDQREETRIVPTVDDFDGSEMHFRSVIAQDINDDTHLDGLTVEGVDASDSGNVGASTYGVWSMDSAALSITNSTIEAGDAADGADGSSGDSGADKASASGSTCSTTGGDGGAAISDSSEFVCPPDSGAEANSGDPGDDGAAIDSGGDGGPGGTNECVSALGSCDEAVLNGNDGDSGDPGSPGESGSQGTGSGSLSGGFWEPDTGQAATPGEAGGAGGGGGAGAACKYGGNLCQNDTVCYDFGGAGGHGGEGGCAGDAGTNGEQGGASFAIFATNSTLTLRDLQILQGLGGEGGDGGDGGAGQLGGRSSSRGWSGGSSVDSAAGRGGDGGFGGDGGDGGAGAAGCGGPSVGIASANSTVDDDGINYTKPSQGAPSGIGGTHQDPNKNDGPDSCIGLLETKHEFNVN